MAHFIREVPHLLFKIDVCKCKCLGPLNIQGKSGFDSDRVKLSLAQIAEGFRFAGLGCDRQGPKFLTASFNVTYKQTEFSGPVNHIAMC